MKINELFKVTIFLLFAALTLSAQAQLPQTSPSGDGIALAPARFELEMKPGTETTVIINLDYRSSTGAAQPTRIVASLNDWDITREGRVEFYKANSRPNSASPWLIYSPGETTVLPGNIHSIRVTVSVPPDASPGDHLTALIIEQRPDTIKFNQNARQMVVRYRMASVFYIKVPSLTRCGTLENLHAESSPKGIMVTPTLKNEGNSVIRPTASVKVTDSIGRIVLEVPGLEPLPLLGGGATSQSFFIERVLQPGTYSINYRIDFQDGGKATEGVTDLVVKDTDHQKRPPQIAAGERATQKP